MGVVRSTYLISEEGLIEKVWPKVKPEQNAGEILEWAAERRVTDCFFLPFRHKISEMPSFSTADLKGGKPLMRSIPFKRPKNKFFRLGGSLVRRYFNHDVGKSAAALSYYFIFSFFPF